MNLHDAWTALRHGGNLLSPAALDGLPAPDAAPGGLSDRLRSALVGLDPAQPTAGALGDLLDVVLEDACGLRAGWQKGNAIGAAHAEKLLDGTALKPRRVWSGDGREPLAVFTTSAARLGVGKGRRPVAQVVEYLRRRAITLALVTNGAQWRLIWADPDSLAWVEWESDRWLDADQLSGELAALRRVLSAHALAREGAAFCPLVSAIRDTRRGQARLSKELGERVRRAVETLLKSRAPVVGPAWDDHAANDLYVASCHFIMRLVVALFAEARELLPVDNPIYHRAYGLRGLLDQLDRLTPERRRARHSAWPRLLALFELLHRGSPHPLMVLPAYGGDLFRRGVADGDAVQRALALIEALPEPPDDDVVHRLLVLLTRTTQKVREGSGWRTVAAPVDFSELTSEYIGILYEGLLDYELHRAGADPIVFLNLGDQPALPLDRLESMDDKALKALVEKAKVKKQAASEDDGDGKDDDEGDDGADPESEDLDDAEAESDDGDADTDVGADDDTPDDARAQARTRALAWGRRAAEVGGLVKKPKGKKADAAAVYAAQLDHAAGQLVADLKLPGELYLVRWGGTRKGAGTFYTRPQLTLPTVRRTLEPLVYEGTEGDTDRRVRAPEAILSLKVCDPAMGSGSFLVAALRVLTAAVVESLHVHDRIERVNGRTTVACELLPEADRSLPTDGFEERLEANVRRAVVEHCLYGVDLDPLAVELARVALWVETLDKRLPFTFLDHKLRCGDALVGTWLDRFRDYPLLCFDRQSPDLKYKGVHHQPDVWHRALKDKRAAAIAEQVDLITGQIRIQARTTSDEELKAAVERVRRLYRELRAVPAGRPDERARIWRERIQPDEAMAHVRKALDTWCALWFWPLDQLDSMPLPSELPAPGEGARAVVSGLLETRRFFHWELEFPDVFTEEGAGFDVVVGNPPWEIQKPNSKEFFSNHDPLYRSYGKQEALRIQKALFQVSPSVEYEWLAYNGVFKDRANFVKNIAEPFGDGKVAKHGGGAVSLVRGKQGAALHMNWRGKRARYRGLCDPAHPFRHQGAADLNTYKMFVEVAHALLGAGGQFGLVVPSGVYTDKGTGDLRKLLLKRCAWRWLYGFENRKKLFDIDGRFKFCVLIARKGGTTDTVHAAFMRHDLEDWSVASSALAYPAKQVEVFSPTTLSMLEIRSARDLEILTRLYTNGEILGDPGPDGWGIQYATDFHMTNDSRLFVPREKAEQTGYQADEYGRWVGPEGDLLLPLYEGRMIGQFDFSEKGWVSGKGRSAVWREIPWDWKRIEPQFLVADSAFRARGTAADGRARVAFMDVTSSTNRRTMVAALIPPYPAGNKVPLLSTLGSRASLLAVLNSLVFDWSIRQRLGGITLNYFILEETALPTRAHKCTSMARLATRLAAAGAAFAAEYLDWPDRSTPWQSLWAMTPHERTRLMCMIDAIVAALWGLRREDFAWIVRDCDYPVSELASAEFTRQLDPKGFWRIGKTSEPELRQTVLSLVAFDDLLARLLQADGDLDSAIASFCGETRDQGWQLPESVCLADLGIPRTAAPARNEPRREGLLPVSVRMGPRLLPCQESLDAAASWREWRTHLRTEHSGGQQQCVSSAPVPIQRRRVSAPPQLDLFSQDMEEFDE